MKRTVHGAATGGNPEAPRVWYEAPTYEPKCQDRTGDGSETDHVCLLVLGHDGPHRCGRGVCGKDWR